MRALTIRQPWASAIMAGVKRVENRTWATAYRGPLVIHAGLVVDRSPEATEAMLRAGLLRDHGDGWREWTLPGGLPLGAALGVVDLVDVVRFSSRGRTLISGLGNDLESNPWAVGPLCWILANPRPFEQPIPCPGRQGLWTMADVLTPYEFSSEK